MTLITATRPTAPTLIRAGVFDIQPRNTEPGYDIFVFPRPWQKERSGSIEIGLVDRLSYYVGVLFRGQYAGLRRTTGNGARLELVDDEGDPTAEIRWSHGNRRLTFDAVRAGSRSSTAWRLEVDASNPEYVQVNEGAGNTVARVETGFCEGVQLWRLVLHQPLTVEQLLQVLSIPVALDVQTLDRDQGLVAQGALGHGI